MSSEPEVSCDPIAVRRTRREKKKSGASIALEKIKRSRETGVREETELEEEKGLFEYVDEEEYAKIVQERQEEGFVLDDDGGYCEHGREIFDEEVDEASADKNKGREKLTKPGVAKRVARPTSNIKSMLMGRGGDTKRKKRKKEESATLEGDNVLSAILQQMEDGQSRRTDSSGASTLRKSAPRPAPVQFTPRTSSIPHTSRHTTTKRIKVVRPAVPKPPSPPAPLQTVDDYDDGGNWGVECDNVMSPGDVEKVEDVMSPGDVEKVEDVMSLGDVEKMEDSVVTDEMETELKPVIPEAAVSTSGWETIRDELPQTQETLSGVQVDYSSLPTQEIDGEEVLPFFWLDAYEDYYNRPGTVYLFGKVWVPQVNTHVSCCVAVRNIERCMYFLPREKVYSKSGKPTDQDVTMEDVYREFNDKYAEPFRIMRFNSKRVMKRYAFDKPEVPHESEYLEVRYSTDHPAPPPNTSGQTFSHIFGTQTSSLERLILHCNLKGPCWLHIKDPLCPPQPVSWCKVECGVMGMDCVGVAKEQAPPPPIVVMSLSFKITLNPKNGTNEVLCVGALIHPSLGLDKPPPKTPFQADFCTIRRPLDRDFPFRFDDLMKQKGFNIEITPSERAMLAYFLAKLHRIDPDIIVGHNLSQFELDVLQHRMQACKVPQWSRIGRLKRRDMPKGRFSGQYLCAGRPVCDVRTSAQELIRAKSYDLAELASTLLHASHTPMEHEDILGSFGNCEALSAVVAHTMDEAVFSLRIMYELNVLPLAYQITCIAGNTLGRTLVGGRAERNEFLLLHAFSARGYVCPDKVRGKKANPSSEHDGGEEPARGKGRKKPAYSGGLVLEPKKGFYDRFILLLDFNSLYPSIMQEYNICFTTIDHAHCPPDEDGEYSMGLLPDPSEPLGVLPTEIRVLVERRRQVKQLMKSVHDNPEQYAQYDIRQKALKLTANSMYGCLGFTNSRFYAKPLAALITGKGREILSQTKDLAQKLNLDVIYGDTDSIMIDSNSRNLDVAQAIAQKVKVEVNKLYRLLEIDVDGIFKAMLLLKKKKYAAVAVEWRDGHLVERRELKGLDIVRRDWCGLAKSTGHYVLDQILSGAPLDEVIERVLGYLRQVHQDVVEGRIQIQEFVITKSLTKQPSDYPDKKSLPHVQVALRMLSRNVHVQPGDVIPYVMCQGESSQPASLRAYHLDEVGKQTHLKLDFKYYLQHQVHAVVSRLCEPIEGLDAVQIAECLGLDPSGYRLHSVQGEEEVDDTSLLGGETFNPLVIKCPHCQKSVQVKGSECLIKREGLLCSECKKPLGVARIANQLTLTIKTLIKKYYACWLVCEDHSCRFRTRNTSIVLEEASPRCPGCHQGKLREEFSASKLYHQLTYYERVFTLKEVDSHYRLLKSHVMTFLDGNQYSKVNLARLFPDLSC